MAMITCRECGEEISSKAKKCPKCGCPTKPSGAKKKVIFILLGVLVLVIAAGTFEWGLRTHKFFLSADSRMQYYFEASLYSQSVEDQLKATEMASAYFNEKYAGTDKEEYAIEMLKEAVERQFGPGMVFSKYYTSYLYEVVSKMETNNEDIETLRDATKVLADAVYIYDIENAPADYIGKTVCVTGRLDKVDTDRGSIRINGFECFFGTSAFYSGTDWTSNRLASGGTVFAVGQIKKYSDSTNPYMQMTLCAYSDEYSLWEAFEMLRDFAEVR